MAIISNSLTEAASLLSLGEIIAIPTETVYGLAANALDTMAVAKIYEAKNRPSFNPLIVHIAGIQQLNQWASIVPEKAMALATTFWPGPLTLVLPKAPEIPELITAGSPYVALRVPSHPMSLELLNMLSFPLAAPSANPSGYISPTQAAHVQQQLGNKIPFILDGGPCRVGLESTIVKIGEDGLATLLRAGGTGIEQIREVIGDLGETSPQLSSSPNKPIAPGMLQSHYAPSVPLMVGAIKELIKEHTGKKIGIISFQASYDEIAKDLMYTLSEKGDLNEAATKLFEAMHELERKKPELIIAEYFPNKGLGLAINDRLKRAAAPRP